MEQSHDVREDAADFLKKNGCEIKSVFFDRRSSSYSVGRVGEDLHFLPTTWSCADHVLDWVHDNHAAVRRAILGEPVEYHHFLAHAVRQAVERAQGDWYVFVAASGPAIDQVDIEAGRAADDEVADLIAEIRDMDPGDPVRALSRVLDQLGLSPEAASTPRP